MVLVSKALRISVLIAMLFILMPFRSSSYVPILPAHVAYPRRRSVSSAQGMTWQPISEYPMLSLRIRIILGRFFIVALCDSSHGGVNMNEIARECGFGGSSYFRRSFNQAAGISPTKWRALHSTYQTNTA